MQPAKKALLAGASGLVGGQLLDLLLQDGGALEVVSLGRRRLDREHPRLTQVEVDFSRLDDVKLPAADLAFCCLGTTLKRAGSEAAFRAVDHDAVVAFAREALASGVRHFLVVTALGANARSRVFYNRVKGEVEASLAALGFDALTVLQPSLLLGDRSESRPGERAAIVASRALAPLLGWVSSRPIEASVVAAAMERLAAAPARGVRVVPSGELHALARA
ncbi:MAG: NAD(P)H-binding protein [Polyangiales bacterium]